MVRRQLPQDHNRLLEPDHTPPLDVLVERRRLGSTDLKKSPSSKAEPLGAFDYAHLRVPLPKALNGSGVFAPPKDAPPDWKYPESYFLMRRSSDGYISATGMFKAAFPWASIEEELTERNHHKKLTTADRHEVAGNVWISAEAALKLADEYNMRSWIVALLNSEAIEKGAGNSSKSDAKKASARHHDISTPPKFELPKKYALAPMDGTISTPKLSTRSTRELRSASPSKPGATPMPRRMLSPRKSRAPKRSDAGSASVANSAADSNSQAVVGIGAAASTEPESAATTTTAATTVVAEKVKIEVEESVEQEGNVETTHTTVRVAMPASHPDLALPESAEEMIAKAKAMVQEARKADGGEPSRPRSSNAGKRKASAAALDERDDDAAPVPVRAPKRARTSERGELKRQKMMNRMLVGISATLAIGAMIPFFTNLLL